MPKVDRIIMQYLQSHRRLVVPQLGAFILREQGGEAVFSELLRRDDGVLRGLLIAERGMNDLEAAGAIDRFVFEVRLALQQGRSYPIPGLGCFAATGDGRVVFRSGSANASEADDSGLQAQRQPACECRPEQGGSTAPKSDAGTAAAGTGACKETEPHVSVSPKCRPEPCVKGLQYGKPLRTTDAYTYVSGRRPRRLDKFMMLAIAAALVALAAILYGYLRERRVEQQERQYLEQLLPGHAASEADDGVSMPVE